LNLKQVRMKLLSKKPNKINLSFNGETEWLLLIFKKTATKSKS
jgi:hypothetical protein